MDGNKIQSLNKTLNELFGFFLTLVINLFGQNFTF